MAAGVTTKRDGMAALRKAVAAFERERVLVGIPEKTTERDNTDGSPLTNAAIGKILDEGAPANNLPARPWLRPGVDSNKDKIASRYEGAAKRLLAGDTGALKTAHQIVGQETADAVKLKIESGPFAPLAPGTVAGRARQRGTKRRASETEYLRLVKQGVSPAAAQAAAGIQPLINTGQLRNAVTFVVRPRGK